MKPLIICKAVILVVIAFSSCKQSNSFKKHKSGVEYKIISYNQSDIVRPGETLKLQIKQVYKDSVLSDTRDSIPFYQVYDSSTLSPESFEIFGKVRKGDSLVFKVSTDSAFKKNIPKFARKGEFLVTHVKVVDIIGVKEDFRDDLRKEIERKRKMMEEQVGNLRNQIP